VASRFVSWPSVAGVVFLGIGLFVVRRNLLLARGWDKLLALGCVFVAAPLAVFGAEHLSAAHALMQLVPAWMPVRLFWAYFVGVALLAAAVSLTLRKQLRWSATLLAIMFFLFVVLIHLPNLAQHLRDRIYWAVALRDLAFAGGASALAGTQKQDWLIHRPERLITIGRMCIGLPLIFFGIEHFLHPEFAPGVPLEKLTPAWVPFPLAWAYLSGAILFASGLAIILNEYARKAATSVGMLMTLLTLFLYLPILVMTTDAAQIMVGVNYVADTLLFGGAVLLLAEALPRERSAKSEPLASRSAS
jgi:uncharacterized membrane protein